MRPEAAEAALRRGDCDAVALGRALIADPDWVAKAAAGRPGDIRPCISTVQACAGMLQFGQAISCAVNPEVGRERRRPPPRARRPRRVVVVGGGPAGMEAACRAAELGPRGGPARAAGAPGRRAAGGRPHAGAGPPGAAGRLVRAPAGRGRRRGANGCRGRRRGGRRARPRPGRGRDRRRGRAPGARRLRGPARLDARRPAGGRPVEPRRHGPAARARSCWAAASAAWPGRSGSRGGGRR